MLINIGTLDLSIWGASHTSLVPGVGPSSEIKSSVNYFLMKIVVITFTNMVAKFTLKAASKKNGLKKVVA